MSHVGREPVAKLRGGRGGPVGGRDLRLESGDRLRVIGLEPGSRLCAQRRPIPVMRLEAQRRVRLNIGGAHRLIEPQCHDHRAVVPRVSAVPLKIDEADRGRRKGEAIVGGKTPPAHRRGSGADGHVVPRRVGELASGIRSKDEDRRPRPAERSADGGRDRHIRRRDGLRNASEHDHRLGEHDSDFVRFGKAGDLASRTAADNRQVAGRLLCR